MLRGEFKLNKEKVSSSQEDIDALLKQYEVSEKSWEKAQTTSNWIEKIKLEDVKKIVVALSSVGDSLEIEVEGYEVEFVNFSALKKLFLISYSERIHSTIGQSHAFNTMKEVDRLEDEHGKCVLKFTNDEMKQSVIDLFSEMKYYKVRSQLNIISQFQGFYDKYIPSKEKWSNVRKQDDIREILGENESKNIITKKDLMDLFKNMDNPQDAILPILIFNGVAFSKVDDADEVRYLKKDDLKDNILHVKGNGSNPDNERYIYLEPDVVQAIQEAIKQEYIVKRVRYTETIVKLRDTEYILRPSQLARKKEAEVADESILSFRGANGRFSACKANLDASLYDIPFSPKKIELYGKIYHINKYINEGMEVHEAIRMTLKRFGDWYHDEKDEAANRQLATRLKRVWEIY